MRAMAGGALALLLFATACGSGAAPPPPAPAGGISDAARPRLPTRAAVVGRHKVSLGTVLVDGLGRTLYLFEGDAPGRSACTGECVRPFPPLLTGGTAIPRPGVRVSLLGVVLRPDGTTQVTYADRPLYLFAGDAAPGDVKGQGIDAFGAQWFVVAATGEVLHLQ